MTEAAHDPGDDAPSPGGLVVVATADAEWSREIRDWVDRETGLETTSVASSLELLELDRLSEARLVVLDAALPGSGGLVTGAMLREILPAVRLVLAVDQRCPQMLELAEEIGFTMVVEKRRSHLVLGGVRG